MKNATFRPLVSIIVPTYNSTMYLDACLQSILNQTYKNIELIVVDNFSTDNTVNVAKKYTEKVFQKGPERSEQVNYGVLQSTGVYVYKVDSDFVLDENVVQACVTEAKKGFEAIVVHNSPDVRVSWIAKIRKFEVDMYKYDLTHSSARFVSRRVYDQIGGFHSKITAAEDYDFQNRLNNNGIDTGFIEPEALHLGEPTSFLKHMVKYYWYGKDMVKYHEENSTKHKDKQGIFHTLKDLVSKEDTTGKQLGFLRSVYKKNWKKFLRQPILGFSFVIYNIFKYTFGGAGFLVGKLKRGGGTVQD